jgi:hypothetical protein
VPTHTIARYRTIGHIERTLEPWPSAEVFGFVATDHFQNHPKWDPAVTPSPRHPRADGRRSDRAAGPERPGPADRGHHGGHRVRADQQLHSGLSVGPFTLQARTTFAPVAPVSTRLELVIDPRPRAHRVVAAAAAGRFCKTMARSLRSIKEQVEGTALPTT